MKRNRFLAFALAFMMGTVSFVNAQDAQQQETPQEVSPNSMSLTEQFDHLKRKSNSWEDYKVIKKYKLNDFWTVVQDSLNEDKTEILQAQLKIGEQKNEIDQLKTTLQDKEQSLAESDYLITHINVLGIDFQKDSYVYINFGIIFVLLVLMGLGYIRYNSSNKIATEKRKELEKMEKEFFDFKQTAREREAKIKREMQTEMNRAEELKKKLTVSGK